MNSTQKTLLIWGGIGLGAIALIYAVGKVTNSLACDFNQALDTAAKAPATAIKSAASSLWNALSCPIYNWLTGSSAPSSSCPAPAASNQSPSNSGCNTAQNSSGSSALDCVGDGYACAISSPSTNCIDA